MNVLLHSESDLENVEEAIIEQNERIKGLLVGHLRYVENIRFDSGLPFIVRIFENMFWTDVDLKAIRHL